MLNNEAIKKIAKDAFRYLDKNKNIIDNNYIDVVIEKYIFDRIKEYTQNVKIVSEEYGSLILGNPVKTVIIDPIDGSGNIFRGIPIYSVAIALCKGNLDFVSVDDIEYSIVVSTFGIYEASINDLEKEQNIENLSLQNALMRDFRNFRMRILGASTVELCLLANGSIDGFVELNGLKSVDLIPELLILKKNGCYFSDKFGNELKFDLSNPKKNMFSIIVARSKSLHNEILVNIKEKCYE